MGRDVFNEAYENTMYNEGRGQISISSSDPGGTTFSGISRVWWPSWEGWEMVDGWLKTPRGTPVPTALYDMVKKFYRVNFWDRIQGDKLAAISPEIACEVFDTAVNMDVSQAVRFLQKGFNVARGESWNDLVEDGKLGSKTMYAIRVYLDSRPGSRELNTEILLNCMNGEQYIQYKANPNRRKFRGWFRRV